jgi:hypothetical protein
MKNYLKITSTVAVILLSIFSCKLNDDEAVTDYQLSEIFGNTYYGAITASSGTTLIPALIIYNDNRCDWNMNTNGMNNNQFYYYSVKNSAANYTLYWFSAENVSECMSKNSAKASMTVQLGINSSDEIVILLTGDDLTGISAMSNTRVPMLKQSKIARKTEPSEIVFDKDIEDISILCPSSAIPVAWAGLNTYSGSFIYIVSDNNGGALQKGIGTCGKDSNGNEIIPKIQIQNPVSNTVTVITNQFSYTEQMTVSPIEVNNVSVSKDGDVYYLHKDKVAIKTSERDLNEFMLDGMLENGILTLRISYKPGKMPFPIVEIFTSSN